VYSCHLDADPYVWWTARVAMTESLLYYVVAADLAEEAIEPVADQWAAAARDALSDRSLGLAARRCAEIAARHCPVELRPEVEAYAEMVLRRRTPGDDLSERAAIRGPLAILEEEAHA